MHHELRNVKNAIIQRLGLRRGRHFSLPLSRGPPGTPPIFFATSSTLPAVGSCKPRGQVSRGQMTGVGLGKVKVEGSLQPGLTRLESRSVNELPGGIND